MSWPPLRIRTQSLTAKGLPSVSQPVSVKGTTSPSSTSLMAPAISLQLNLSVRATKPSGLSGVQAHSSTKAENAIVVSPVRIPVEVSTRVVHRRPRAPARAPDVPETHPSLPATAIHRSHKPEQRHRTPPTIVAAVHTRCSCGQSAARRLRSRTGSGNCREHSES